MILAEIIANNFKFDAKYVSIYFFGARQNTKEHFEQKKNSALV